MEGDKEQRMIEYCCGFVFNSDKDLVVLIQKNRPEWMAGKINGVGGKVESSESPAEAMSREFMEEAGHLIPATEWKAFCSLVTVRGEARIFFFYTLVPTEVFGLVATMESEQVLVCSMRNLPCNLMPNLKWLLEMAKSMGEERADLFLVSELRLNA